MTQFTPCYVTPALVSSRTSEQSCSALGSSWDWGMERPPMGAVLVQHIGDLQCVRCEVARPKKGGHGSPGPFRERKLAGGAGTTS